MDERQALSSFAALSQETRLAIVRALVIAGPEGLAAGVIAERMGVSATNVSFHLKELERSGLISQRRESRSIIYNASYDALADLVKFLMEDCCAGHQVIRESVERGGDCCSPAGSRLIAGRGIRCVLRVPVYRRSVGHLYRQADGPDRCRDDHDGRVSARGIDTCPLRLVALSRNLRHRHHPARGVIGNGAV